MPRGALAALVVGVVALIVGFVVLDPIDAVRSVVRASAPEPVHRHAGRDDRRAKPRAPSPARSHGRPGGRAALRQHGGRGSELLARAAMVCAALLAIAAFVLGLPLAALSAIRLARRRRRPMRRWWVLPFRTDEAAHESVRRLLESWHQQLLEPWWRRPFLGQPGATLELVTEPDGQGGLEARLLVALPDALAGALEGSLRACYPDSRLVGRDTPLPDVPNVMRLKKRHHFIRALRVPEAEGEARNVVDAVLTQMAALGAPAIVQISLLPAAAWFERRARRLFRREERRFEHPRAHDTTHPGLRSQMVRGELQSGMAVQHRPLFFADIRVGAASAEACRAVCGVLRGESGAENRLIEWPFGGPRMIARYRRRIAEGWTNPLGDPHWGVMSSSELAALWHLPSPGLTATPVRRSSVPRATATPEVSRDPAHALVRDERGPVGILAQDKSDGLGLIGGQKTGKTSVLCQSVRVDAADDDCAVIVLMPKPGDARVALSMVPEHRTLHYLDFERPELGINPLLAEGDVGMVADKIVEAFRDVNEEGDIKGSSDRFLRQAAQAAIAAGRAGALDVPPNLWHMYRMLLPSETAFRDHVVGAIYGDSRFTDTATFFGRDLPNDLRDATVNTTSKLDAPRNKILRLMVESLDKVLRHPVQLSIDEVIRNHEILIVDGKMGTFGADNCRVMMQFILSMLYGALQRQQQLPEHERTRVALKVDEAHLIINDSFADAMATLRSAGLEVVAAWQYGEQIQDPKLRAGMMSLLRQRCMFSMGESKDAREMTDIAMTVYVDLIKDDMESRARVKLTPDVIFNLPNHRAVCSWIARGARARAFLAETIPSTVDERPIEHHLRAQRERGRFVPERLPSPLPAFGEDAQLPPPALDVVGTESPVDEGAVDAFDPTGAPSARGDRRAARPRSSTAPESYAELDLDEVRGVAWDDREPVAPARRHEPSPRELEILAALWQYRHMFTSQIHRRWWPDHSLRACQQTLNRMAGASWVRRFRFTVAERGAQQRAYTITREGFELAQRHSSRNGPYVDPEQAWREPPSGDPHAMLRDLHVVAWVSAFEALAPGAVRNWRGPAASRLLAPRRKVRGDWVDMGVGDLPVGGNRRLRDAGLDTLRPVNPAATVELRIPLPQGAARFDLLVELDRSRGAAYNEEKLRRYDLLLAGWFRLVPRFQKLGKPPAVVFVCEDEGKALAYLRTADRVVTTRLAEAGTPEAEWPCPARKLMLFVVERDLHSGLLDALALPEQPPEIRKQLDGRGGERCRPRAVQLVDPKILALAETAAGAAR